MQKDETFRFRLSNFPFNENPYPMRKITRFSSDRPAGAPRIFLRILIFYPIRPPKNDNTRTMMFEAHAGKRIQTAFREDALPQKCGSKRENPFIPL